MSSRKTYPELERDLLDLTDSGEEGVAPGPALRERLLATLDEGSRFAGFVRRVASFLDLDPDRTRSLLGRVAEVAGPAWEDGRLQGVRLHHFDGGPRLAGAHCGLVYVVPGISYPAHLHRGDEWAFVLQGTAREDSGRLWAPGDVVRSPEGSRHSFTALGPEPFVFVVVVHDGIDHEPEPGS